MNSIPQGLLILTVPLVVACAASPKSQIDSIDRTQPTVATLALLPMDDTLVDELRIQLTDHSPIYNFPEGRSPVAGFKLPIATKPYELQLRTYLHGGGYDWTQEMGVSYFLAPAIAFLDQNRQLIASAEPAGLEFERFGFGGNHTFVGRIPVPAGSHYGILYSNRKKAGEKFHYRMNANGITFMVGNHLVSIPGGPANLLGQFNVFGDVAIKAIQHQPGP